VKVIQPAVAVRPQAVQLFLREASILSQLRHPRIVEYLSLGLNEGQMYFAMEYVPAIDLAELLATQSRPRQIRVACGLVSHALEALQFAHERDLVHRDVKPSNLLPSRSSSRTTSGSSTACRSASCCRRATGSRRCR